MKIIKSGFKNVAQRVSISAKRWYSKGLWRVGGYNSATALAPSPVLNPLWRSPCGDFIDWCITAYKYQCHLQWIFSLWTPQRCEHLLMWTILPGPICIFYIMKWSLRCEHPLTWTLIPWSHGVHISKVAVFCETVKFWAELHVFYCCCCFREQVVFPQLFVEFHCILMWHNFVHCIVYQWSFELSCMFYFCCFREQVLFPLQFL